jgi:hypothetical protein
VLRELRVLPESPAQKLVDIAGQLDPIQGVGGILAADRIFGLLERDFSATSIERAVGAALKPQDKAQELPLTIRTSHRQSPMRPMRDCLRQREAIVNP